MRRRALVGLNPKPNLETQSLAKRGVLLASCLRPVAVHSGNVDESECNRRIEYAVQPGTWAYMCTRARSEFYRFRCLAARSRPLKISCSG
jgi:hypothetical protein